MLGDSGSGQYSIAFDRHVDTIYLRGQNHPFPIGALVTLMQARREYDVAAAYSQTRRITKRLFSCESNSPDLVLTRAT
jgi:hypothetical protein